MKVPNTITALIIGVVVTLLSIWYGQNNGLMPVDASAQAPRIDQLFNVMMGLSTGLFLIVQGALLYSLFAFRQRQGDNTDAEPIHGNVPLEILWTAIPSAIVLWLAVYSFDVYKAVDSGGPPPMTQTAQVVPAKTLAMPANAAIAATLPEPATESAQTDAPPGRANQQPQDPATEAVRNQEVPQRREAPETGVVSPSIGPSSQERGKAPEVAINVTGLQYAWIFTYPDSGVVSGELHVPTGQEVKLTISANDVIHAFWVPEFRLKQDAIPGRQTRLRFTPTRIGTYPVICAELCGAYHGAMKTKVIVQTPGEYSAWLQSQVATTPSEQSLAMVPPQERSPAEFLAPYLGQMGLPDQLQSGEDLSAMTQSTPAA